MTTATASLLPLLPAVGAAVAALVLLRALVPGARREVRIDAAILGIGVATAVTGFAVLPASEGAAARLVAALLLAAGTAALGAAAVCGLPARTCAPRASLVRLAAAHALLLPAALGAPNAVTLPCAALAVVAALAAVRAWPRTHVAADVDDDGAERPFRRHLLAPVASITVFPASLAALLVLEGPSTLAVVLWGAGWSIAGLLLFARQNWVAEDRHRTVARERDLRVRVVRQNVELTGLRDLAAAVAQARDERTLVDRALRLLQDASGARSVHVELSGEWHVLPAGAALPGDDEDALSIPVVVRDEGLGTVTLAGCGDGFDADVVRHLVSLVDGLAVGVSHVRDYNEKSHQALRDPLTGIYNRRVLNDALSRELLRAAREDGAVALTLLDIDDFKSINDVHGHDTGDEVLRRVAACGRDVVRPGDTFARIGGEEFALLTPGAGAHEALLVAERLRQAVARLDVLPDRSVTVSAGLAAWPADAADGDGLRRAADEALYRAKAAGKNRCELAGEAPAPA